MCKAKINRRHFLINSSLLGCSLLIPGLARAANINELSGTVYINKRRATPDMIIRAGDLVTTGDDGRISFSINKDAYLLKESTSVKFESPDNFFINALRVFTGKFLSVYEKGPDRKIITATATIGIRGTGFFINVQPGKTYFCTCYGKTVLNAGAMHKEFEATHHDAYELELDGMQVMGMHSMQVLYHTDDELRQLEAMVGRVPPFDT